MNRIEFMTELASLLQDISVEERKEAMQYYNNYFDDAGQENEEQVVEELGNPVKVALEVKAGLKGQNDEASEFSETGYQDTRFEEKERPMTTEQREKESKYSYESVPPRTNAPLKILLIVLIALFAVPIALPVVLGIIFTVIGVVIALFCLFFALVIASIAVVITGICLICAGVASMIPAVALGVALVGAGLLVSVIGIIATVASTRLCMIVFPGIIRGIVWMCRKPFERRAVA